MSCGRSQYYFIVELDEWIIKAFFFFLCVVPIKWLLWICPVLSLRSSRHFPGSNFSNYLSSYENYTPLTPTSGFYYMTHYLVNWLEQLVGPECILKISQANQILSWLGNDRESLKWQAAHWLGGCPGPPLLRLRGSPGPVLLEISVQPCFGFCARPHEPCHKSLLDIISSSKEANQRHVAKKKKKRQEILTTESAEKMQKLLFNVTSVSFIFIFSSF